MNIDDIIWGDKTPYEYGVTKLPLDQPLRLWWSNGVRSDYPPNWLGFTLVNKDCTHYALPVPPKLTVAEGYWGPPRDWKIVAHPDENTTHAIRIAYPGDTMPEFKVDIPGGGYVEVTRRGEA